jgi:tetratricopeptide (TPR) repeat protein
MQKESVFKKYSVLLICICLITSILLIYWQVQYFEFIDFDDNIYVTDNRYVQRGISLENFFWAFISIEAANWHPLSWLSLMLDYELYGLNAGGYHWTNLILHIVNSLFLFLIMNRMTGEMWKSAFVASVFAVHPVNVESVAWVSERKNVLSMFFWIMTIWAYVFYVERPDFRRYLLVIVTFTLGLMAKPMLVTLPFVLFLLDYWPLGRFSLNDLRDNRNASNYESAIKGIKHFSVFRLILEKIPFFVLSAISSIVTVYAAKNFGAIKPLEKFPFDKRIVNAFISYSKYLEKTFWPDNLCIFYPYWINFSIMQIFYAILLISVLTLFVLWAMKRYRYLAVGWFWYVGTLLPVIGLVQVGYHSMADRYAYGPLIGIFIMLAWGVSDIYSHWFYRKDSLAITTWAVIILLMACTWLQVKYWKDSFTVYQRALAVTTNNHMALSGMGNVFLHQENLTKAADYYLKALHLRPDYADVRINLGIVYLKQGKYSNAISQFQEALKVKINSSKAHNNIGIALALQGKIDDAVTHFQLALKYDPYNVEAQHNLSIILDRKGKLEGK